MCAFTILAAVLVAVVVEASALVNQPIAALSASQIDFYTPYTNYASTAYCTPAETIAWNCGRPCDANPSFQPVASGGDGAIVQLWFVGYDPTLDTIIVAHEGTEAAKIFRSLLFFVNLDPDLFKGISTSILVHQGFRDAQANTANDVLSAVGKAMKQYGTTSITLIGHSLGAAIAVLDSVYLPLWLPAGTTFKTVTYGLPRVGNHEFADYVDANVNLTHIGNKKDLIPTLPPMGFHFVQPSGEVHIQDSGAWLACPGQDNPSKECIVGDVPTLLDGDLTNHPGPYNGITMGCR
ncbi:Alpha/Beta hydrolase protein [Melanogaster broomeanus]|nr:Alpha/Beta hydrolase protein [Melanogaster broomeanus]